MDEDDDDEEEDEEEEGRRKRRRMRRRKRRRRMRRRMTRRMRRRLRRRMRRMIGEGNRQESLQGVPRLVVSRLWDPVLPATFDPRRHTPRNSLQRASPHQKPARAPGTGMVRSLVLKNRGREEIERGAPAGASRKPPGSLV